MATLLQPTSTTYPFMYRALVEANYDPLQLGRIRARAYPMFSGIQDVNDIPWAAPAMPLFCGAGNGTGSFSVPSVGSLVWVFFETGSIYQPVYFAEAADGKHGLPGGRTGDYPNTHVVTTPGGVTISVDDSTGDVRVTTKSGDVSVQADVGDVNVTSGAGSVEVTAGDSVDVTAISVTVTAPTVEVTSAMNVTGSLTVNGVPVLT